MDKNVHHVKTWIEYYEDVRSGKKPFEARLNDRDYKDGDILVSHEYNSKSGQATGRYHGQEITYVLHGPGFGIEEGYVVLGLSRTIL